MAATTLYSNIRSAPPTDGIVYCDGVPFTTSEADLYNQAKPPGRDPAPVSFTQAVVAIITLSVQGAVNPGTTWVVMQTDLASDGNWVDLNWLTSTIAGGSEYYTFSNGVAGANSFQKTRAAGVVPATPLGYNQCCLGGRIRFVGGRTTGDLPASSSYSSGVNLLTARIVYKLLGLR